MHAHDNGGQRVREMRGFRSRCGLVFSGRVLGLACEHTLMARVGGAGNCSSRRQGHIFHPSIFTNRLLPGCRGTKRPFFFFFFNPPNVVICAHREDSLTRDILVPCRLISASVCNATTSQTKSTPH